MILALVGTALALAAALAGLVLIGFRIARRRMPRRLLAAHPVVGITALICLWVAFALWRGPHDLAFDAGTLVLTFAFAGGVLMFALRATRLPRPFFVAMLHGAGALFGCALLIVGLARLAQGA
jgi:peptidoglycan/LPS O-acetylase OafA/YrhL